MSEPIINQPWEDVASDVTDAIEKAVQPLLKKATDEIYSGLLDTTQDYLRANLAFNIAERINAAERQAYADRIEAERLRGVNVDLLTALKKLDTAGRTAWHFDGRDTNARHGFASALTAARAAIAKATGAGA